MARILQIIGQEVETSVGGGWSNIEKMQMAVQIAALVRASFVRPTDSDIRDMLLMVASQLSAPPFPRE